MTAHPLIMLVTAVRQVHLHQILRMMRSVCNPLLSDATSVQGRVNKQAKCGTCIAKALFCTSGKMIAQSTPVEDP